MKSTGWWLCGLVLAAVSIAWLGSRSAASGVPAGGDPAPTGAAVHVHLDPETGELLDAPHDLSADDPFEAVPVRAPDYSRFEVQILPGVGTYLRTGDELMMVSRVAFGPDGNLVHDCQAASVSATHEGDRP